jgi:hypothetical protein
MRYEFISAMFPPDDEHGDLGWVRDTLLRGFDLPEFKSCLIGHLRGGRFVRLWASENPGRYESVVFAAVENHEREFVEIPHASEMDTGRLVALAVHLSYLYAKVETETLAGVSSDEKIAGMLAAVEALRKFKADE